MLVGKKITILSFEHISTIFTDQNLDLVLQATPFAERKGLVMLQLTELSPTNAIIKQCH